MLKGAWFKTAWILPMVMLVTLIVAALFPAELFAAERSIDWSKTTPRPTAAFKNLPGVKPEEERVQKPEYTCSTDIEDVYRPRGGYQILYGDRAPRRVYRCTTENGVTYTSTQPPNTQWVPGLNPYDLPK